MKTFFSLKFLKKYGSVLFSLNGILKKSGSVGRWETKQFIGMALLLRRVTKTKRHLCFLLLILITKMA